MSSALTIQRFGAVQQIGQADSRYEWEKIASIQYKDVPIHFRPDPYLRLAGNRKGLIALTKINRACDQLDRKHDLKPLFVLGWVGLYQVRFRIILQISSTMIAPTTESSNPPG
jgi:hypothetical protein